MFSKVFRKTVLKSSLSRSYLTNTCKLQNNLQVNLKHAPCDRRYINTSYFLYYSQKNLKKEIDVNEIDKNDSEKQESDVNKKSTEINLKKDDKSSEIQEKKEFEEGMVPEYENIEFEKEKRKDKQWRRYGREVILHSFATAEDKNRETFLECLRMYTNAPGKKLERVLFIYAALKYMEEFGVHKDLEVYKCIINIFPKESMIPTNIFQTWFMHYPKEQYCAVAILEQMENNAVIPDPETETILLNIFGSHGLPLQKYWKMMYWMPKFKHKNPWPVPNPLPKDTFELAKLAMIKISSVDVRSVLTVFDTNDVEDSIDKTWIVSVMAPKQSELLKKQDKKTAVYVEGPFKVYVATEAVDYFTLRADPLVDRKYPEWDPDAVDKIRNPYLETSNSHIIEQPSVHEQTDSTIFANCATGTSTKDSLLSWIRCLQKENPVLGELPVVFTLRKNYSQEKYYIEEKEKNNEKTSTTAKDDSQKQLLQR